MVIQILYFLNIFLLKIFNEIITDVPLHPFFFLPLFFLDVQCDSQTMFVLPEMVLVLFLQ